jgi:hypothetical protein
MSMTTGMCPDAAADQLFTVQALGMPCDGEDLKVDHFRRKFWGVYRRRESGMANGF